MWIRAGHPKPSIFIVLCSFKFCGPQTKPPTSTEWRKKAPKAFFRLAGLLVVGKNFSGPKKFFSPFGAFGPQTFNIHCAVLLGFLTHVLSASLLRKECAHLQPPCSEGHTSAGGHQLQMCLAIGLRRDQHKPRLSTLRRARQTHQEDFRLTLVSQNQNAKPCSEIPSAVAYERMMSFQVS